MHTPESIQSICYVAWVNIMTLHIDALARVSLISIVTEVGLSIIINMKLSTSGIFPSCSAT
jgi:hypothetical protein